MPPVACSPRRRVILPSLLPAFTALVLALSLVGCEKEKPKAQGRPPVEITEFTIEPRDTPVAFEFVGQTQSSREVEIRARVDGFLEKRVYVEGELVFVGQPMFLMDRKPFEAALQQAKGELAQRQAQLDTAKANLTRIRPLAEQNAVSKKDLDDAVGAFQSAEAQVLAAKGNVRTAELNLSYTTISSPLTGLSSFAKLQDGAYVNTTNSLLTTVSQLDPIWVNYSISENELLKFREEAARGLLRLPPNRSFQVEIVLADGSVFPDKGRVTFSDPSFSKETGTFLVRAVLANPKPILRPGQFVRVRVLGASRPNAILVPQRAVLQGAKSHFVWVIGKDDKVEQRVVEVGDWHGDQWFINEGLKPGEKIVVDGAIRMSVGATVKVVAKENAWYRVVFHDNQWGDRTGYILATSLHVDEMVPAPAPRAGAIPGAARPTPSTAPPPAAQQSPRVATRRARGFVSINGAYQGTTTEFSSTTTFVQNAEVGNVSTTYGGGHPPVIDVSGTGRVWRSLALSVAGTWSNENADGVVTANVPHPFQFNALRPVQGVAGGLKRQETSLHVDPAVLLALGDRLQLAIFGGPSYFRVRQGLVTGVTVTDVYPYDTATFASATTAESTKSGIGYNAGADLAIELSRNVGVGVLARYSRATLELDGPDGGTAVEYKAGGLQVGGGLRFRF